MATAKSHPKAGFQADCCSGAQWNTSALEAQERIHVHSREEQGAKAKLPQLTYLLPKLLQNMQPEVTGMIPLLVNASVYHGFF